MSQQQQQNNRFLLAHSTASNAAAATSATSNQQQGKTSSPQQQQDESENQLSVDEDFDSYWEEEARNPHRNRIRIGRQYQATVPPLLKSNERGNNRKLEELETLSFCPKKSAKVSDTELDHYFTVAKSLNLFAELVETRSLLGRDVTIADLNHIRHKEGLSLASVIQPVRHQSFSSGSQPLTSLSPQQQQSISTTTTTSDKQSPAATSSNNNNCDQKNSISFSPKDPTASTTTAPLLADYPFNQPLMKALSHFISLHHPCHHDRECKKLLKDIPLEDNSGPAVSITAGNLRQGASTKEAKLGRSRSSAKHCKEESTTLSDHQQQDNTTATFTVVEHNQADNLQSPSYDDWTREEVELFSKAIEVCGKNFSSIKKEFLPSKSVKSIVEYYYIGSRDVSDSKKKSNQTVETSDSCGSQDKALANNNGQGGGSGPSGGPSGKGGSQFNSTNSLTSTSNNNNNSSSRTTTTTSNNESSNKPLSDSNETPKQTSQSETATNLSNLSKQSSKTLQQDHHHQQNGHGRSLAKTHNNANIVNKNIDARMSVYNFDEEFRDDNSSSPARFDCPRPGAEVKPLKAKPIVPNAALDSEPSNSNVGSLKFFMDGQLVLKLNACQEQQEGIEKCHWVQSGEKVINAGRQKRYTKRAERSDLNQNGSQSNSVVSSFQDDDSKNDDLSGDEDSKESMNSFTNLPQQQKNQHVASPTPKRLKIKSEPIGSHQQQSPQLPSPINYNRLAVNNRMKERNDNLSPGSMINQATAMPWLQANSFAMAAALLKGLPFQPGPANLTVDNTTSPSNVSTVNMTSKPMDLSLEHGSPKATIHKPTPRSRGSRSKNV